jgi:hypothetical protein
MKDTNTEFFFFFSEEDLGDFHDDTHKFGGLRFFLELAVFLAVKLGVDNPKSCISFFRVCRKFLEGIEGLMAYDGYKYSASGMVNFLLFVRLCRFKTREDGLEFLERYKGWAIALGFNKGVPHESDVTKFVNFNEDGFELEFNVKKTKEAYYEHIESINSFVAEMGEKRDIQEVISLSH